jgi:hypothetical protein
VYSVQPGHSAPELSRHLRPETKENAQGIFAGRAFGEGSRRLLQDSIPTTSALQKHLGRLCCILEFRAGCHTDGRYFPCFYLVVKIS